MFGGCWESGPNRFVRFVKGIWGVMTLFFDPGVLPGYWLSSQRGHSVKGTSAQSSGVVSRQGADGAEAGCTLFFDPFTKRRLTVQD